jgi:DHA2 family multidrug resistance protein
VMAAVFLVAFVIRELRVKDPIVHFHLLRFRSFATGIGLAAVLGFVLYGGLILLPLFMQTLLGWTAATAGLWTSPRGIGTALCMPLVGYLLGRGWDGRRMLAFGFGIAGLSFFGFAHMTLQSGTWDIFWIQILQGAAMGLLFVPLTTLTMASIPTQETGYATSLYSVSRNIGSSMGISFVTTWITRRSQFHQSILASHITATNQMSRQAMDQITGFLQQSGTDHITARHRAGALIYRTMQQQAALLSYVDVFRIMGALFLLVIPLVFLMKRPHHASSAH